MIPLPLNQIIQGDCLEVMKTFPDKSIDMILCDLPYGTTACSWDTIIPFEPLWEQYKRIIKDNGAIVLTASQPFTSALVMSNIKMFKYCWIWEKEQPTNPLQMKRRAGKTIEECIVFYKKQPTYNPQMTKFEGKKVTNKIGDSKIGKLVTSNSLIPIEYKDNGFRFPTQVLKIKRDIRKFPILHPTQKPVALFEYLIKTYTSEGDLVLDNCAGSGTTGVAAKNLKRNFILIEKEEKYCKIAQERLDNQTLPML
jgi:site-specific DNA-methyltransferase (adenine-specific)